MPTPNKKAYDTMSGQQTERLSTTTGWSEREEFTALLEREFRPSSDQARSAVVTAVRTLATRALADTTLIASNALSTIEAIIAEIDRKLTEQINLVLHQPQFQALRPPGAVSSIS